MELELKLKFIWKHKQLRMAKKTLREELGVEVGGQPH